MQSAISLERKVPDTQFFSVHGVWGWLFVQVGLQRERAFLWSPVFFACGIGAYYALPVEPPALAGVFVFLFFLSFYGVFFRGRAERFFYPAVAVLLMMAGFCAAQFRTLVVDAPMIERETGPVEMTGTVFSVEDLEGYKGQKIVFGDLRIEDLSGDDTPRRVRLSYRADPPLHVGERVKLLVMLHPPSTPVIPGGFDFRRYMFFQQIGAVGFVYKNLGIIEKGGAVSNTLERLRQRIDERIIAALPGEDGTIAAALMVGKRGAISEGNRDALRGAGLAHILAISGLHVGLMSGALFFVLRFIMACFPVFALRYPIKKIAAVMAFCGALAYMMIAGATLPTQRAVLMSGVVFLAIVLDRSAISMRLVAFAALVVLAVAPESLLSASFHMSFAAVAALVAFYDATRGFWSAMYRKANVLRKVQMYFLGVCMTTLIASAATGFYALYHFQRFAVLGLVANFMAVPLMAFVIMPCALLAFLLMPFGFEFVPLWLMGKAIGQVLVTAHWVSALPMASWQVGAWPIAALLWFTAAGLWLCLWRGVGKVLSLAFFVCGVWSVYAVQMPAVLVSQSHKLVGVYDGHDLYVNTKRADKFTLENWERALGLGENSMVVMRGTAKNGVYGCDDDACRLSVQGLRIEVVRNLYALAQACVWADVVVVQNGVDRVPDYCRSKIMIDRFASWRSGAYAVFSDQGDPHVTTSLQKTGVRPWSLVRRH